MSLAHPWLMSPALPPVSALSVCLCPTARSTDQPPEGQGSASRDNRVLLRNYGYLALVGTLAFGLGWVLERTLVVHVL